MLNNHPHHRWGWLIAFILVAGCQSHDASSQPLPAPEVTVATPVEQEVTTYERFTGRTEPFEQVEVRARVTGHLVKAYFEPGAMVEKGKPLFDVDARPFEADLEKSQAEIQFAEARLQRTTTELERARKLRATNSIAQEELDKFAAEQKEADAAVKAAKAKVAGVKLNVEFAKITAPISGLAGDRLIDVGNLVTAEVGTKAVLTTIVAVDPMAVAFDLDENTLQRLQQAVREGKLKGKDAGEMAVELALPIHKNTYPLKGVVKFVNNRVDPKTGTIRVKAEFANPKPEVGERVLTAGMFVRVRVPIGDARKAVLVPESALGMDQGRRFLYTVDSHKKAVRLEAMVGDQVNDLRVIEQVQGPGENKARNLGIDERIIVKGLQRVRPGQPVEPKSH